MKFKNKVILYILSLLFFAVPAIALAVTLTVPQGGTGAAIFTGNGVLYGNGINQIQVTSAPTAGQLLLGNGSGVPVFRSITGDVTINSSGVTAIGADKITESMLKAVNAPTDELCLSYESSVGDFEWQSCGSVGSSVILDLADDGSNESTALGEIAITGDTNSIFSEPSNDKLLIAVGNAWPTASALAANPTDCAANQFANAIAANGNLTCAGLVDADVPNILTLTKVSNLTSNGFVKTSGGDGTLSVDTSTYLTGNQTITLSGDVSGSGATAITVAIGSDKITEAMLKAVDTAADEECLSYESTVGDFEWQSCGTAGANTALSNLASVAINTALLADTDNAYALGSATKSWSDLFLGSGAVVDFQNGDVTLTHSADTLTLAGGSLVLPGAGLTVGSSVPFSDSAGTLTLQNVDAIDATTEATIEPAIDTLANLTSIQGFTFTLTGNFIRSGAHALTLTTSGTTNATYPSGTFTLAGINLATQTFVGQNIFGPTRTIASGASAVNNGVSIPTTTTTISGSTNITTAAGFNLVDIQTPTYSAASALTISNAATVYIANSPSGGGAGPATITNAYSLWVDAGTTRLDGSVIFGSNITPQSNDGAALGTGSTSWSDLFLASGGVINFNNGNVTITHSAGALAVSGSLSASNLSGTNTGDQTITLTGDVTGSGTGSFAASIGSDKVTEAMLKAVDAAADEECLTYESTVGDFEWQTCGAGGGGSGDVVGPASSTDNAIVRFDGTTGKLVQNSGATLQDDGDILLPNDATYRIKGTDGDEIAVLQLNSNNDLHFLPNLDADTSNDINNVYFGYNAPVNFTFGGSCCGGSLPLAFNFDSQNGYDFRTDGSSRAIIDDLGLHVGNTAGVLLTADGDGAITFKGEGNGSDENLTINLDDTSNEATVTSSTSLNLLNLSGINLRTPKIGVNAAPDANRLLYVTGDVSGGVATIERTNASTNAAVGTVIVKGTSTGDMLDGFGSAFQFAIQDTAAVENLIADIRGVRNGSDTTGRMIFGIANAGSPAAEMELTATALHPSANDGNALGTATLSWADLFLASGGVINFNNGNYTVTHSAGLLTFSGGITATGGTVTLGTLAGTIDAGGATSFEIPNGTSPTNSTTGQIAIDTTDDQLRFRGASSSRNLTWKYQKSYTLENPNDADNFLLFKAPDAISIEDIQCIVDPADSSESVVIDVQERDGSGDTPVSVDTTITCSNTGAGDDNTFSNAAIDANDWVSLDIGTVTGTVTQVSVTILYSLTTE